jgi:hypothetical protein
MSDTSGAAEFACFVGEDGAGSPAPALQSTPDNQTPLHLPGPTGADLGWASRTTRPQAVLPPSPTAAPQAGASPPCAAPTRTPRELAGVQAALAQVQMALAVAEGGVAPRHGDDSFASPQGGGLGVVQQPSQQVVQAAATVGKASAAVANAASAIQQDPDGKHSRFLILPLAAALVQEAAAAVAQLAPASLQLRHEAAMSAACAAAATAARSDATAGAHAAGCCHDIHVTAYAIPRSAHSQQLPPTEAAGAGTPAAVAAAAAVAAPMPVPQLARSGTRETQPPPLRLRGNGRLRILAEDSLSPTQHRSSLGDGRPLAPRCSPASPSDGDGMGKPPPIRGPANPSQAYAATAPSPDVLSSPDCDGSSGASPDSVHALRWSDVSVAGTEHGWAALAAYTGQVPAQPVAAQRRMQQSVDRPAEPLGCPTDCVTDTRTAAVHSVQHGKVLLVPAPPAASHGTGRDRHGAVRGSDLNLVGSSGGTLAVIAGGASRRDTTGSAAIARKYNVTDVASIGRYGTSPLTQVIRHDRSLTAGSFASHRTDREQAVAGGHRHTRASSRAKVKSAAAHGRATSQRVMVNPLSGQALLMLQRYGDGAARAANGAAVPALAVAAGSHDNRRSYANPGSSIVGDVWGAARSDASQGRTSSLSQAALPEPALVQRIATMGDPLQWRTASEPSAGGFVLAPAPTRSVVSGASVRVFRGDDRADTSCALSQAGQRRDEAVPVADSAPVGCVGALRRWLVHAWRSMRSAAAVPTPAARLPSPLPNIRMQLQ